MQSQINHIPSLDLVFHLQDGHNKSFLRNKGVNTKFLPNHSDVHYIVFINHMFQIQFIMPAIFIAIITTVIITHIYGKFIIR